MASTMVLWPTQLDSAIGDADHGTNMRRGFTAVLEMLADLQPVTVGEILLKTGNTLVSSVGGAAGPLFGSAFRAMGKALDESEVDGRQVLSALTDGLAAIQRLGAAVPGDKTMVDTYAPAIAAREDALSAGADLATAAAAAADAAEQGMRDTTALQARKGRASYLGARSIGHQGPGRDLNRADLPCTGDRGGRVMSATVFSGHLASAGTALGFAHRTDRACATSLPPRRTDDPVGQITDAFTGTAGQLRRLAESLRARGQHEQADIMETTSYIADDNDLHDTAIAHARNGDPVTITTNKAVDTYAAALAQLDDPVLADRATDVRQVGRRALAWLHNTTTDTSHDGPLILLANEIGAADLLEPHAPVVAAASVLGGPNSHASIVARSLGIPLLLGIDATALECPDGTEILIDDEEVIAAGHRHQRQVSVCGGVAAHPQVIPLLVGLDCDILSVAPAALDQTRAHIRRLDHATCAALATTALTQATPQQVWYLVEHSHPAAHCGDRGRASKPLAGAVTEAGCWATRYQL